MIWNRLSPRTSGSRRTRWRTSGRICARRRPARWAEPAHRGRRCPVVRVLARPRQAPAPDDRLDLPHRLRGAGRSTCCSCCYSAPNSCRCRCGVVPSSACEVLAQRRATSRTRRRPPPARRVVGGLQQHARAHQPLAQQPLPGLAPVRARNCRVNVAATGARSPPRRPGRGSSIRARPTPSRLDGGRRSAARDRRGDVLRLAAVPVRGEHEVIGPGSRRTRPRGPCARRAGSSPAPPPSLADVTTSPRSHHRTSDRTVAGRCAARLRGRGRSASPRPARRRPARGDDERAEAQGDHPRAARVGPAGLEQGVRRLAMVPSWGSPRSPPWTGRPGRAHHEVVAGVGPEGGRGSRRTPTTE